MDENLFTTVARLLATETDASVRRQQIEQQFSCRRAVMVLDSSGFTRVSRDHGIHHFLESLVQARLVIGDVLSRCNAVSHRFEADNAFAQFERSESAVDAAFAIHEAIDHASIALGGSDHFRVCIGVGYGNVLNAGHEGCYGDEVNLASKLGEDTAEPGEVLLTESALNQLPTTRHAQFEKREVIVSGVNLSYFHSHYRNPER